MISIFDWYNQETKDLHYTLKQAGLIMPTIVLEEDGFLPDDIMSPYRYFCKWSNKGKTRYFNEVPIDCYDEIIGNNAQATIYADNVEKAIITYYTPGTTSRIVKEVTWFLEGNKEKLLATDYYNQYGYRYAQTIYDVNGKESMKFYYDMQGNVIITENKIIGDIILNEGKKIHLFKQEIDFFKYFLQVAGFDLDKIFYNTLATSFLLTLEFTNRKGEDVLFWHEKLTNPRELPGNMQYILEKKSQTKKIYFQLKEDYDEIRKLNQPAYQMIDFLGFAYPFERENLWRKEILILTNSDQIEGLNQLVTELSDYQFHIGALTEMSKQLMDYQHFENVHLYPNISREDIEFVFVNCDIYLDINYGDEILNAVHRAFLNNMVIFGFQETIHERKYISKENIYNKVDVFDLIDKIRNIHFTQAIKQQQLAAGAAKLNSYKNEFNEEKV